MISPETFARYAAMRVPRYTSYPSSPHFSPAIDSAEYRRWLRQIDPREPLSVYLHIPFCREMCSYCGCHTTVTKRQAPIGRYVSSLIAEIQVLAVELPSPIAVRHLHWGGGSPTLLTPGDVERIHHALADAFELGAILENAVEIDPRTLTEQGAAAFARAQVNRASVGIQTFDAAVQAAIRRVQSFEVTAHAVDLLRSNGIRQINFDLIYGLPNQTVRSCLQTVWQALQLRPDRLSVFGYAHVPGFKPHQRKIEATALPGAPERQEQFRAISEALVSAGYVQVGLDHFALPQNSLTTAAVSGRLRRNFQGYTADSCPTLLGFGASAIGRLPAGFVQNTTRIPEYERRIAAGKLAIVRGCRLSDDDRLRAAIIEQLMCTYKADVGSLAVPLDHMEADGLVRRSGTLVEVVGEARPLVRTIAAAFDAYFPNTAATHAVAI
jgi:oxygen-independent coproporphyrinogen-3 oxidase